MAANLVKAGFEVFGYDPVAASRQRLKKAGGHACKSAGEVAQHATHLLLSLPNEPQRYPVAGKVAWITGGGSGIGLAGAIELVKAGVHVVISGRTPATNASALAQLQALGSAQAILLDVADKQAVHAAAQSILAEHGRIDMLINSAGTNATARNFDVLSTDAWDDVVGINLSGTFYCAHAALPAMRAQQSGLIINVSSWAGLYATKLTGPAYNTTKRAVLALTESINMEECTHGIRATAMCPGEVATPILDKRPIQIGRASCRERVSSPV